MALRVTKVDEYQFLTCLKHNVWGSKTDRFKSWKIGDRLAFIVNKQFTALSEVVGNSYRSDLKIWDNGDFPYRIDIKFNIILSNENRIPVLGEVRDALISSWGTSYGWGILNQQELPKDAETTIINAFKNESNDLKLYQEKISELLNDAKQRRDEDNKDNNIKVQKKRGRKKKLNSVVGDNLITNNDNKNSNAELSESVSNDEDIITIEEGTQHTKAQNLLIKMGKITGCSVWVASNDYNKKYQGESLGKNCINSLPNFGLAKEAMDRITYIDVIWIQQNAPVCAFEVETTTSIYSGILRMADLIALVPALKIKLFIVAPKARQKKVMQELNRPTFKKIGLNEYCRFISIEDLDKKLEQIEDLYGDVRPTIIEKLAIEADKSILY